MFKRDNGERLVTSPTDLLAPIFGTNASLGPGDLVSIRSSVRSVNRCGGISATMPETLGNMLMTRVSQATKRGKDEEASLAGLLGIDWCRPSQKDDDKMGMPV